MTDSGDGGESGGDKLPCATEGEGGNGNGNSIYDRQDANKLLLLVAAAAR